MVLATGVITQVTGLITPYLTIGLNGPNIQPEWAFNGAFLVFTAQQKAESGRTTSEIFQISINAGNTAGADQIQFK